MRWRVQLGDWWCERDVFMFEDFVKIGRVAAQFSLCSRRFAPIFAGKITNCTVCNSWNYCTPLNQSASSDFVMLMVKIVSRRQGMFYQKNPFLIWLAMKFLKVFWNQFVVSIPEVSRYFKLLDLRVKFVSFSFVPINWKLSKLLTSVS